MGRVLIGMIARDPVHKLAGAVEAKGVPAIGSDAGEVAGAGPLGLRITDDYAALARPDTVTLDFTNAAASLEHLNLAASNGAAIVVASTGFNADQEKRAAAMAPRTRTVIAPNLSIGVNVLSKIVEQVAAILPDFRTIAAARKVDFKSHSVFGREGITGVRPSDQISVIGLRAGDAVGDHTVIFGGQGERLELIHRAQRRDSLARGALRAAAWLEKQKPGLYSMRDVLGL